MIFLTKYFLACLTLALSAKEAGNYEQALHGVLEYQDIIINGAVVKPGIRECNTRYTALKKIVSKYQRPFTVLDIGAAQGFFSFKLAHEFPATCVMIEGFNTKQLLELCKLNTELKSIMLINRVISASELERMAECEHFDVVLALNIIHHFDADWKKAAQAILNLGDHIIIETPPTGDTHACGREFIAPIEEYLLQQKGTIIAKIPRHTSDKMASMFHFARKKKHLTRTFYNKHDKTPVGEYVISSDWKSKKLYKRKTKETLDWHPGINLATFKSLNGVFPTYATIRSLLEPLRTLDHNDLFLWNIVIQGKKLVPIDFNDEKDHKQFDVQENLNACITWFSDEKLQLPTIY